MLTGLALRHRPNLVGVLLHGPGLKLRTDSTNLLQDQGRLDDLISFMKEGIIDKSGDNEHGHGDVHVSLQQEALLLISPISKSRQAVFDFTSRQCEILSLYLDMARGVTLSITIDGQQEGFPRNPIAQGLPGNFWSCFSNHEWSRMTFLEHG